MLLFDVRSVRNAFLIELFAAWPARATLGRVRIFKGAGVILFVSPQSPQVGPELKQENRGETKHQLFGGCFAWHSKVETKQETSSEFMFRFK